MEELGGGASRVRNPPPPDRFLAIFNPPPLTAPSTPPLELSEHDIFNTPSGSSSSSSPTHPGSTTPNPTRNARSHNGILAALNDNLKSRSGSDIRPVFNHKASASASLSSSSSTSPATSASSRVTIPKRPPPPPPVDRMRLRHQSAPVNVPVIPAALMRRAWGLDEVEEEQEEVEEEDYNGGMVPPHELVAARHSPVLASSVLEGIGRTLKGRDLRQVRNAVWRKTGFID